MPRNRAPHRLSSLCGQLLAPRPCAAGENFTITPAPNCTLGAYVRGLSLAEGLSPEAEQRVKEAFLKHAVLIFEGQEGLTMEQQIAFGKLFGKLEFEKNWISNQRQSGEMIKKYVDDGPADDGESGRYTPQYMGIIGNHAWHQDSTYMPVAAKAGIIYAEKMPPPGQGGETEWMDMRAAFEALDDETKARVERLSAYHSGQQSSARRFGVFPKRKDNVSKGYGGNGMCYLRPLVKTHPETGRKSLYIGQHAFGVTGMPPEESTKFLDELVDLAYQSPQRVFRHDYRVGDLALFDNRCLCHRGRPYDISLPRQIRLTRVAGESETESALPDPDEDRALILQAELDRLQQLPAWDEEERSKHLR